MKLQNAKNLRELLFAVYLASALVFTVATLGAGYYFHQVNIRNAAARQKDAEMLRRTETLLSETADAAGTLALLRTPDAAAAEYRVLSELRDAAEKLADNRYGQVPEYRSAVRELKNAADCLVLDYSAGQGRPAAEFEARHRQHAALLREAADALRNVREIQDESTMRTAALLDRRFWILEAILIAFFLCSILLTTLGFSLIGRAMRHSMRSLSEGTRALRSGDLTYRFHDITPDETGMVKYDFNIMAHRLASQAENLRKANAELREQAEKLMAADQHKDRFLSNMSHELRTPLSSIIGFTELIRDRADRLEPQKLKTYAARILTAAEHLLELITSLLDLAKSGAGVLKAVPVDFDMAAAVQETAALLRPLAEKKGLELRLDLPGELIVHADPRMIRQIFINLLGNAVKYTLKGSVSVSLKKESGKIILSVTDTGIGIPEQEHDKIFTDFHRVDNGPDFMTDGVGIGLALSRRLAELHQGTITFESTYGEGSVFTFTFPA